MSNTTTLVNSKDMERWEHRQAYRDAGEVLERIAAKAGELRAIVGKDPVARNGHRVVVRALRDRSAVQVYFPGYAVAGQGRCLCEAMNEAAYALESIVDVALRQRDWSVVPAPDRSIRTLLAAFKTECYFRALQFASDRLLTVESVEVDQARSTIAAALAVAV